MKQELILKSIGHEHPIIKFFLVIQLDFFFHWFLFHFCLHLGLWYSILLLYPVSSSNETQRWTVWKTKQKMELIGYLFKSVGILRSKFQIQIVRLPRESQRLFVQYWGKKNSSINLKSLVE